MRYCLVLILLFAAPAWAEKGGDGVLIVSTKTLADRVAALEDLVMRAKGTIHAQCIEIKDDCSKCAANACLSVISTTYPKAEPVATPQWKELPPDAKGITIE